MDYSILIQSIRVVRAYRGIDALNLNDGSFTETGAIAVMNLEKYFFSNRVFYLNLMYVLFDHQLKMNGTQSFHICRIMFYVFRPCFALN